MLEQFSNKPFMRLEIIMKRDFNAFGENERDNFLDDLELLSGSPRTEFRSINFKKGCILFKAEIDKEAANLLHDMFEQDQQNGDTGVPESFKEFMANYKITAIKIFSTEKVEIFIRNKMPTKQVLFIHGWRGDKDSFGKMPEFLSSTLGLDYQIYEYPTSYWGSGRKQSIEFIAHNLDNWIRNHMKGVNDIGLVTHSMGGLVAETFITNQHWRDEPLDRRVKQITLIAVPQDGSEIAALINKIEFLRNCQLRELDPNSGFLFSLKSKWNVWCNRYVPNDCQMRCIFGTNDNIVSVANASGFDPEAIPILGAGHRDIVKPKNLNDEIVITINRFMEETLLSKSQE